MIVVVNDANILIDLVKLQLLSHFFSMDLKFYTRVKPIKYNEKSWKQKAFGWVAKQRELVDYFGELYEKHL